MQRTCGDCQLCCRLLPTKEIDKPALQRCPQQCRNGCAIYEHRPFSCRAWSCMWLLGFDVGQRPDRSHLVVDPLPDFVHAVENEGGAVHKVAVVQVWIDPAFPDAHRDPAFRRWLDAKGAPGLIRYSSNDCVFIAPPSYTREGWYEEPRKKATLAEHTFTETVAAVGDQLTGSIEIKVTP